MTITFHDDPALVEKVRTLDGRIWHAKERNWTMPFSEGIVKKILKVFEWEDICLDAAIDGTVPNLRTERSGVVELGLSPAVYAEHRHDTESA